MHKQTLPLHVFGVLDSGETAVDLSSRISVKTLTGCGGGK